MHCARVASHAGDFESAHTIVPYSWAAVSHGQPSFTSAWREFAAVRSATAMRRRHEVPDRHPNHQGQADVHQVRRPPVAEQPDRGRKHDGRADHAEQTAQPLPMTEPTQRVRRKASAANSGSRRLMNSPSYWLRSPARWPRRSWRGLESRRRSPSRKRRCRARRFYRQCVSSVP